MPRPLIKKFKTENSLYVYDVFTNEILRTDSLVFEMIDEIGISNLDQVVEKFSPKYHHQDIIAAWSTLMTLKDEQGFFASQGPDISFQINSEQDIEKIYQIGPKQLILELTRQCNQRCKYCAFSGRYPGDRTHSPVQMPESIALQAVDFFMEKAINHPDKIPAITFYGGEPLLNFKLLERVIQYVKRKAKGREYSFSLTTNGTLLNERIIQFFADNNIPILISLDGPQEMHDRYRVFPDGSGTFAGLTRNLKWIKKDYPQYFLNHISFNAVIAPPYHFDHLIDFFYHNDLLESIREKTRINFVSGYGTTFFSDFNLEELRAQLKNEIKVLRERYEKALIENQYQSLTIEKSLFLQDYYDIDRRFIEPLPGIVRPKGICTPGLRRLFVDTEGFFYMCEKVGSHYPIGHVESGFDSSRIFKFLSEYESFFSGCRDCWGVRLCKKCYNDIRKGDDFDRERRDYFCQRQLQELETYLISYCKVKEKNPNGFKFLEDVIMT